jgi:hypothetical protein
MYSISTLGRGGLLAWKLYHIGSKKSTVEPRHHFLLIFVSKFLKNINKVLTTFRKIYKTSVAGFPSCCPSADKRSITKNLLAVVLQNMMFQNIFLKGRKCFFADAFYSTVFDYQMLEVLHIIM